MTSEPPGRHSQLLPLFNSSLPNLSRIFLSQIPDPAAGMWLPPLGAAGTGGCWLSGLLLDGSICLKPQCKQHLELQRFFPNTGGSHIIPGDFLDLLGDRTRGWVVLEMQSLVLKLPDPISCLWRAAGRCQAALTGVFTDIPEFILVSSSGKAPKAAAQVLPLGTGGFWGKRCF